MALQLVITIGFALLVAAIGFPFGEVGWVTALMVSSTPLVALQFSGRILLERSLAYKPLAVVEVSQVITYQAWAIVFVLLGFGVWGLASATIAMRAVAALVMIRVCPVGFIKPRFSWILIRPLMSFGIRFQATSATWLVRDQGLNASIAVIAGVSTLGLWSLARRLMEVPFLLFDALWRVSFPAMSQLIAAEEDPVPLMERAASMAVIGSGFVLTGIAGSAPGLLPGLFGEQWRASASVIPFACLGLSIGGSVSVAIQGYLYALNDSSAVLRASILQTIALFAVAIPLLPVFGVAAVGLGWVASSVVEAIVLRRATLKWTRVSLVRPLLVPVVVGAVSSVVGWLAADLGGADLLSGLVGGACSLLCFIAGLFLFQRDALRETLRFGVRSMGAAVLHRTPSRVQESAINTPPT
jgi:O-antigen/teichoic acid export membrane protein